ncbi:MAG: hypothetical protein KAS30_05800 [Candidatus Diapherotrites archaeon]|nr:hypothetical protein [Candidatus Diapherotrites archaeon]
MKFRGQAFDTFKLLIAALVAVSILAIMMGIIGGISIPGSEPTHEIKSTLNKAMINIGNTVTTSTIKFIKGETYCIRAMILNTGLQESMIKWDNQHNGLEEFTSSTGDQCIQTMGGDVNGKATISCWNDICTITLTQTVN